MSFVGDDGISDGLLCELFEIELFEFGFAGFGCSSDVDVEFRGDTGFVDSKDLHEGVDHVAEGADEGNIHQFGAGIVAIDGAINSDFVLFGEAFLGWMVVLHGGQNLGRDFGVASAFGHSLDFGFGELVGAPRSGTRDGVVEFCDVVKLLSQTIEASRMSTRGEGDAGGVEALEGLLSGFAALLFFQTHDEGLSSSEGNSVVLFFSEAVTVLILNFQIFVHRDIRFIDDDIHGSNCGTQ